MDREKTVFRVRKFLNKKGFESSALIFAEVNLSDYKCKDKKKKTTTTTRSIYSNLKISDCDKIISLSTDIGNKKQFTNTLHKLNTIINTLSDFKETLVNEFTEREKLIESGEIKRDRWQ